MAIKNTYKDTKRFNITTENHKELLPMYCLFPRTTFVPLISKTATAQPKQKMQKLFYTTFCFWLYFLLVLSFPVGVMYCIPCNLFDLSLFGIAHVPGVCSCAPNLSAFALSLL